MSNKLNFDKYYNNYNDFQRNTKSFMTKSYNPYFPQDKNPFSLNNNDKKKSLYFDDNTTSSHFKNNVRNTMPGLPFPNDSIDNENTFAITPEKKLENVKKIKPKKQKYIKSKFYNNGNGNNFYQKGNKEVLSENSYKIRKSPIDELSDNNSYLNIINSKSENVSEKDKKNNQKSNSSKNDSDNNSNNAQNKTNNKVLLNNNLNQNKNNTINQKSQKKINNSNQNNTIIDEKLKNQFINRNISIFTLLKKRNFFENLKQISHSRMQLFEKEFQNDIYFKKKDFYNNNFIINKEIDINQPLTIIFYYILNPERKIEQFPFKKNFCESVLFLHGFKNIKINYDYNNLNQIPKYFNDLSYVNNLFQKFEINELTKFVNDIKNWPKKFDFEISYEDLNDNKIIDKVKIYFISPIDITVEYNSISSNSSESFAEYNFHCDIDYNKNKGRFTFNNIANVYNKCDELWQYEFLGEIWERAIIVIKEESRKNKIIGDKIFKEHLKNNLSKYSSSIDYIIKDISEKEQKDKTYILNNSSHKIIINKVNKIMNNYEEINNEKKIINSIKIFNNNNKIQKNNKENIEEKKKIIINKNENDKENIIINYKEKNKEQILFYGVILSFFIFIFKTVLSIELGTFSLETFFNIIIIIIIGFMLCKNQYIN